MITTGETIFAADDVVGTAIGASKDDIDGDYKPLKGAMKHVPCGTNIYNGLNLFKGTRGGINNFRQVSSGNVNRSLPLFLDGYGIIDSGVETYDDNNGK